MIEEGDTVIITSTYLTRLQGSRGTVTFVHGGDSNFDYSVRPEGHTTTIALLETEIEKG
jgi:hypothetical protein